jgi:hypothetical protein
MQTDEPRKKAHFSRGRFQSNKKKEIPMPEHIVHRSNYLTDDNYVLPKLNGKTVVLFPEEYANIPVSVNHKKELNRLKHVMNKTKETEH